MFHLRPDGFIERCPADSPCPYDGFASHYRENEERAFQLQGQLSGMVKGTRACLESFNFPEPSLVVNTFTSTLNGGWWEIEASCHQLDGTLFLSAGMCLNDRAGAYSGGVELAETLNRLASSLPHGFVYCEVDRLKLRRGETTVEWLYHVGPDKAQSVFTVTDGGRKSWFTSEDFPKLGTDFYLSNISETAFIEGFRTAVRPDILIEARHRGEAAAEMADELDRVLYGE